MFRVSQHPSSGVLKTVTAASGTGHDISPATSFQRSQVATRPGTHNVHSVSWNSLRHRGAPVLPAHTHENKFSCIASHMIPRIFLRGIYNFFWNIHKIFKFHFSKWQIAGPVVGSGFKLKIPWSVTVGLGRWLRTSGLLP